MRRSVVEPEAGVATVRAIEGALDGWTGASACAGGELSSGIATSESSSESSGSIV